MRLIWEAWFAERPRQEWHALVKLREPRRAEGRHLFAVASEPERAWIAEALADDARKWLAAAILEAVGNVPRRHLDAMLRAGVYEANPSYNRTFVRPCVVSYGNACVVELLLAYLEHGTNREKAGAAGALYWAWERPKHSANDPPGDDRPDATPASRQPEETLASLRSKQRTLYLREFVTNSDLDVRRRIIAGLSLDPDVYPPNLRPRLADAIRIGRGHPDEYVRHRVAVQLGERHVLSPLPPLEPRSD